jgi:hypothetical protein
MKFIVPFIMILMGLNFACSSSSMPADIVENQKMQNHDPVFFGNTYGTITDSRSGAPVKNATIYVTKTPVQYLSRALPGAVMSDQGPVIIPDRLTAVTQASSGDDGTFIVNSIPISGSSQVFTVLIQAEGYDITVIDQVLIFPGASMALRINCRMTSDGRARIIKVLKGHGHVDINYSDELRKPSD